MRLADCEMRPGIILNVLDNVGTITASVPGLFSKEDADLLPPIHPLGLGGSSNSFSTPNKGDEVYVIFNHTNPEQLFWIRKDNFTQNNGKCGNKVRSTGGKKSESKDGVQAEKNIEVLSSRESGLGWATIYFSDGSGWVIQNADTVIQLDNEGSIVLSMDKPHQNIEISDNGISLGTLGGSAHPVCHGDKVQKLFENIINTLTLAANAAKTNPYTAAVGTAIETSLKQYQDSPDYINSEYVTVD